MLAVVGSALGSLDNFRLVELPVPEPRVGEVRVRVHAVGLGPVDGLTLLGRHHIRPSLPYTPGCELAGTVEAVGSGVETFSIGNRVAAWLRTGGGLAEQCLAPAAGLQSIESMLEFDKAAALVSDYATAYHGLKDRAHVSPGETLLVLGADGALGIAAIEIGKLLGARVIGTAYAPKKSIFARFLGADELLDCAKSDWRKTLLEVTNGRGVDVVFDSIGGELSEPAFRSLAQRGRHLVVQFARGSIPALPVNLALLKGAELVGVDAREFTEQEPDRSNANFRTLLDWSVSGILEVPIGPRFPLERFDEALLTAMSPNGIDKVIVALT